MTDSKLIERVRKLYAMSQDASSPHEAAIAAKRARSLMDKNGITVADLETSQFGDATSTNKWSRMPIYVQGMAITVSKLNDCKVERQGKSIIFKGFEDDAITAQLMFEYLLQTMERCCEAHIKQTDGKGLIAWNDYRLGFEAGVKASAEAMITERKTQLKTSGGSSLVVVKMEMVNAEFGITRVKKVNTRDTRGSADAQAGYEQGRSTSINSQVSGKAQAQLTA